jgi:uncharacterized protein YndB with AHSA1/START domain
MSESTRNIERELFIEVAPEQVWHAITEAEHIASWFAPEAQSAPGVGGHITLKWSADMQQRCEIHAWEPGEHLRMSWHAGPDRNTDLPVEIHLTAEEGGTRLRLVHYGFLSDASWDDEYNDHARGWAYELRSLKYYLEHQFGRARAFVHERIPLHGDLQTAWARVIGPDGVFAADRDGINAGDVFRLRLSNGQDTSATLMLELAGQDFAVITDLLNGGILRFALETAAGQPEIWVWAFSWRLAERQLRDIVQPLFDAVQERLAA